MIVHKVLPGFICSCGFMPVARLGTLEACNELMAHRSNSSTGSTRPTYCHDALPVQVVAEIVIPEGANGNA